MSPLSSLRAAAGRCAGSLVLALLVLVPACRDGTESPTAPEASPSLATAGKIISFQQISAGSTHTCGVSLRNKAYCWGAGGFLGDGTTTSRSTPVPVAGGLDFLRVSVGHNHTCGITIANVAYCWGRNDRGQLGVGNDANTSLTPVPVAGGRKYRQISAGVEHTCAVTIADVAYCWGNDDEGQVGVAGFDHLVPTAVEGGLRFRQVIAGAFHTCGATTDFKAYCWGTGAIGNATGRADAPALVGGGLRFKMVVAGAGEILIPSEEQEDFLSCGLTTDDLAYCWSAQTPIKVAGTHRFRGINLGAGQVCAVTLWDKVFCWGSNEFGQLGNGTTNPTTTPVPVAGSLQFRSVTANPYASHTCAISTTYKAYCWGRNQFGKLGDGTTTDRSVPTQVAPTQ